MSWFIGPLSITDQLSVYFNCTPDGIFVQRCWVLFLSMNKGTWTESADLLSESATSDDQETHQVIHSTGKTTDFAHRLRHQSMP